MIQSSVLSHLLISLYLKSLDNLNQTYSLKYHCCCLFQIYVFSSDLSYNLRLRSQTDISISCSTLNSPKPALPPAFLISLNVSSIFLVIQFKILGFSCDSYFSYIWTKSKSYWLYFSNTSRILLLFTMSLHYLLLLPLIPPISPTPFRVWATIISSLDYSINLPTLKLFPTHS